jgi:hypothetical protein
MATTTTDQRLLGFDTQQLRLLEKRLFIKVLAELQTNRFV